MVYAILLIVLVVIAIIILWIYSANSNNTNDIATMEPIPENTFPFPVYVINLDRKPERYTYVTSQLDHFGITGYQKWSGTDGFKVNPESMLQHGVSQELIDRGKGLAGCASSHVRMWRHIAENKLGWSLILEDDAHFHPQFMELFHRYWSKIPVNAKIIFPGFCAPDFIEKVNINNPIIDVPVMCLHGYMLNADGAQYLLDHLLPMKMPVDIEIVEYFRKIRNGGSYIFNGNRSMDGIRPYDYKESNGRRCMFNGIIYQNHREHGSTIHEENTVY